MSKHIHLRLTEAEAKDELIKRLQIELESKCRLNSSKSIAIEVLRRTVSVLDNRLEQALAKAEQGEWCRVLKILSGEYILLTIRVLPKSDKHTADLDNHTTTIWDVTSLICNRDETHAVTGSSRRVYCHQCGKYWDREDFE